MGMLTDITAPYSHAEAWAYDKVVAPAVLGLRGAVDARLLALVPEGARVLDVGCGGGHLVAALAARRPDVRFTGLDLSPGQVARARKRTADFGDRVTLVEASALEMPLLDDGFDAVISVASIKHWPDPARGLAECARVLAPGGWLAVVEADRGCSPEAAEAFVRGWGVPALMRPLARRFFLRLVAGRSLGVPEAEALVGDLGLSETSVERVPDTPGWLMLGRKVQTAA